MRRRDAAIAFVVACALLMGAMIGAYADTFAEAVKGFAESSLSDTGEAIEAVVASGDPLARPVLEALQDARLQFSAEQKLVLIKGKDGNFVDASTGAA